MQIFVKAETGRRIDLKVLPEDTIASIKARVENKLTIPFGEQHLFFDERPLNDEQSLKDYGIQKGSTLILKQGVRMQIRV